jgi:hypothetical protein
MCVSNENIEFAGADILIETIEADVVDEFQKQNLYNNNGYTKTGNFNEIISRFVRNSKTKALDKLKADIMAIAESYGEALKTLPNKPDQFEIDLSMSVSAKGDICIVSSETTSMVKVLMKWGKS